MSLMDRLRAPLLRMGPGKLKRILWLLYAVAVFLVCGELYVRFRYPDRWEFSIERTLIVVVLLVWTSLLHVQLRRLERR